MILTGLVFVPRTFAHSSLRIVDAGALLGEMEQMASDRRYDARILTGCII